jgi:tetratricopeptide (TPR) repeat protein
MQIGYDEPDSPEWIEAAQKLEWAQELNPNNTFIAARATYCRGRAAYLQKDLAGALSWWTKAAALDKAFVLPVNGIGMVHTANNSFGLARTFFLQALERDAGWPFPEENIGNTYWEEKDYETAKQYYRKAIAKAPNWSKPHIHLAYIALTEKDYATAVSEFETALAPDAIGLKGKEPAAAQKALEKARQKLSEQGY